jgi:PAS domain S-box-containing protein
MPTMLTTDGSARPGVVASAGAGIAILVGTLVLLGWLLDVSALRTLLPGTNPMVASTAACFIFTGVSLWLQHRPPGRGARWAARTLALAAATVGLLKLAEYTFGWDLGIDQTFGAIHPGAFPGEMALLTAITFTLSGTALAILDLETRGRGRPAQVLAVLALVPPTFGLIGRLYGVPTLSGVLAGTVVMALHTGLAFLALGAGILAARPDRGLMRVFTASGPAGLLLRRLLPGTVLALILTGWLRVVGQREALFGTEFGAAVLVVSSIIALTALIWLSARSIERSERALRSSDARIREIFENSPDAIVTIAPHGRITYFSPGAQTLFGYPAADVLGQPVIMLMPEKYRSAHQAGLARYLATGQTRVLGSTVELEGWKRNGEVFPLELSLSTWQTAEGPAFIGVIRDLTVRREAERAQAVAREAAERAAGAASRLAAIVEGSDDAIISKTPDGVITSWNEGAERLYGYGPEEAIGQPITLLFPESRRGEERQILEEVLGGRSVDHHETERLRKDGSVVEVSLTVSPIREPGGKIIGASSIARNITEQRRAHHALQRAQAEAERANRAKSEFLSRMSHELRTPLNAVLGFGQLLQMEDLDADSKESVGQIVRAGRHLLDLINEVLDISRIEAGKLSLSLEPVSVLDLATEAAEMVRPMAVERRVTLQTDPGELRARYVLADRQRLRQVILNLLSNAVKYNREGGWVTMSLRSTDEGRVRLEVADSGHGIAEEERDRLFLPFQRLGAEANGVEGTGLGLALSKGLVEAMGGAIGASSVPGEGSTFWVDLAEAETPAAAVGADDAETLPAPSSDGDRTVLYVEDNVPNLRLVEQVAARRPHIRLLSAMQGQLGIDLARQHHPDLILLDLHLPDMSGEEVLRTLRGDPVTSAIPVVMISADATPSTARRLLEAGARSFLTKPLDMRRFVRLLEGR